MKKSSSWFSSKDLPSEVNTSLHNNSPWWFVPFWFQIQILDSHIKTNQFIKGCHIDSWTKDISFPVLFIEQQGQTFWKWRDMWPEHIPQWKQPEIGSCFPFCGCYQMLWGTPERQLAAWRPEASKSSGSQAAELLRRAIHEPHCHPGLD